MKNFIFLFLFLIFISGCVYVPESVQNAPKACTTDDDCICGGIDITTDNCFVGNKKYAEKYVDFSRDCPDFCTGIAAHLETRCVQNECKIVRKQQSQPVACTEEAKLCPDGSAVAVWGLTVNLLHAQENAPALQGTGKKEMLAIQNAIIARRHALHHQYFVKKVIRARFFLENM